MLRTVSIGTTILIQGLFVRTLANGKVVVAVGSREYQGTPVSRPS